MNHNVLQLGGRLTKDIELRYASNGTPIASGGIAVNKKYRDANGEQQEKACFCDFTAFKNTAEAMAKYLSKGRSVLLVGELELDQWEDRDGNKRSKHKMLVRDFQFADSNRDGNQGQANTQQQPAPAQTQGGPASGDIDPDTIPFAADFPVDV